MPTVATKNGGPTDIMATLHHGLLVDPVNAMDIASACFRILTSASTWDQMSHSGASVKPFCWHLQAICEDQSVDST